MNKLLRTFLLFLLSLMIIACQPPAPTPTKGTGPDAFDAEVQRLESIAERRGQSCCITPLAVLVLWVVIANRHFRREESQPTGVICEHTVDQTDKANNGILRKHKQPDRYILMVARLMLILSITCVVILWRPFSLWPVLYWRLFHFFEIWGGLLAFEIGVIVWIEMRSFGPFSFIRSQHSYIRRLAMAQFTLLIAVTLMIFAAIQELSPWVHVESRLIHGKRYNLAATNAWLDEVGATYFLFECDVSGTFCSYICASPYIPWSYATLSGGLEYESSTNELWIQGMFKDTTYCRYQLPGD